MIGTDETTNHKGTAHLCEAFQSLFEFAVKPSSPSHAPVPKLGVEAAANCVRYTLTVHGTVI